MGLYNNLAKDNAFLGNDKTKEKDFEFLKEANCEKITTSED